MKNVFFLPYKSENNNQYNNENIKRKFEEVETKNNLNNNNLNKKIKKEDNTGEIENKEINIEPKSENKEQNAILQSNTNNIRNEIQSDINFNNIVDDDKDEDNDCLLSLGSVNESDLHQKYDVFCNG